MGEWEGGEVDSYVCVMMLCVLCVRYDVIYIYIYIHTYICIHIYIYIYTYRDGDRDPGSARSGERRSGECLYSEILLLFVYYCYYT